MNTPRTKALRRLGIASLALALIGGAAFAGYQLSLTAPVDISVTPATGSDGDNAFKGKLVYMQYETSTGSGIYQDVLLSVYADSPNPANEVWDYDGKLRGSRDIFATRSTDGGTTWSTPENLTGHTTQSSAVADSDGIGPLGQTTYWGDCDKPTVIASTQTGKNVVIVFGSSFDASSSGNQGSVVYPEFAGVEVPYKCTYIMWTKNAGATWNTQQMSDGTRDSKQQTAFGSGAGFTFAWQEDPHGLQPGQAEGPGDGGSGAKTSQGTDIWYTAASRTAINNPTGFGGFPAAVRVTDNFTQRDQDNLESGPERASRPNLKIIGQAVVIAYEETKGLEKFDSGKYIRYHTHSPFTSVATSEVGVETHPYGLAGDVTKGQGWIVSNPTENARRVRILGQGTPGATTGMVLSFIWRQGLYDQGGPADIMCVVGKKDTTLDPGSTGLRPEDFTPSLNYASGATYPLPKGLATGSDRELAEGHGKPMNLSSHLGLTADSDDDNIENSLAHRGIMEGDFISVGYSWTRDGTLARYTDLENFNFFLRRSSDGGQTWSAPQNLTNVTDTKVSVREPRMVKTPKHKNPATPQDKNTWFVAWGTELNQYEHLKSRIINESIYVTRTTDNGASFEPVQLLAEAIGDEEDQESQLRPEPEGKTLHAVFMNFDSGTGATNVMYTKGTESFFADAKADDNDDENCSTGGSSSFSWLVLAGLLAMGLVGTRGAQRLARNRN